MSKEFVQFTFPCSTCLVQAACKDKPVKKEDLYDAVKSCKCLTLPAFDPTSMTYHKMMMECYSNFGPDLMNHVQKSYSPSGVETHNSIPVRFMQIMIQMTAVMQYMVNSTSWREGDLKAFDKHEINLKLKGLQL